MIIRQVSKYVYDCFFGTGWPMEHVPYAHDAYWSRVRRNTWGLQVMQGARLHKDQLNNVSKAIEQHPHGSVQEV